MSSLRHRTLAVLLLTAAWAPAGAQEAPLVPPEDLAGLRCVPKIGEGKQEILRLWRIRGAALRAGNAAEAERVMEQIGQERETRQIDRLPGLAAALLAESEGLLAEGNRGKALESARWAADLDAHSARARFQLARVAWRSGDPLSGIGGWVAGGRALMRTFWGSYVVMANLAMVLALALALAGGVFSVVLLLRHGTAFVHEWVERLPKRWSEPARRLAGRAVLFLPLATFIGGAWALLWFPAILVRHLTRSERALLVLLLVLLVLSGPGFEAFDRFLSVAVSPTARVLADGGHGQASVLPEIRALAEAQPDVAAYHFLLAGLYAAQITGPRTSLDDEACFALAESEYLAAIRLEPGQTPFRINLGNLYARNGSYREAWNRYQEVLQSDQDSVLAAYNLAAAYGEDINRLQDKEAMLARAREVDADELDRLMGLGGGSEVVDARLTVGEMGVRVFAEARGAEAKPRSVLAGLLRLSSIAGIVAGLLALLAFFAVGSRAARRCERCGRAFCFRCKTDREGPEHCIQCLHLFLKRDGVAPGVRERKTRDIDRYERRWRLGPRLVGLVLPGTDRMLRGRVGAGFVLTLAWVGGWLWLTLGPRLLVAPDASLAAAAGPRPLVIALLAAIWLVSNLPRRRHRSRRAA